MAAAGGGGAAAKVARGFGLEEEQTLIAQLVFGKENLELLKSMGIKDTRSIYEVSSPDVQCNYTIGEVTADTTCWICGLRILEVDKGQCEHILPIVQAYMFLGLYHDTEAKQIRKGTILNSNGKPITEDAYMRNMRLEYAWAHGPCNLIKNDDVYIKISDEFTQYEVDTERITKLLTNIWSKKANYANIDLLQSKLRGKYGNKIDKFINKRRPIMEDRLQQIVNHMNREDAHGPAVGLTVLSGISALHIPPREEAHKMLGTAISHLPSSELLPDPSITVSSIYKSLKEKLSKISGGEAFFYNYMTDKKRDEMVYVYTGINEELRKVSADISTIDNTYRIMNVFYMLNAFKEFMLAIARGSGTTRTKGDRYKSIIDKAYIYLTEISGMDTKDIVRLLSNRADVTGGGGGAVGGAGASMINENVPTSTSAMAGLLQLKLAEPPSYDELKIVSDALSSFYMPNTHSTTIIGEIADNRNSGWNFTIGNSNSENTYMKGMTTGGYRRKTRRIRRGRRQTRRHFR